VARGGWGAEPPRGPHPRRQQGPERPAGERGAARATRGQRSGAERQAAAAAAWRAAAAAARPGTRRASVACRRGARHARGTHKTKHVKCEYRSFRSCPLRAWPLTFALRPFGASGRFSPAAPRGNAVRLPKIRPNSPRMAGIGKRAFGDIASRPDKAGSLSRRTPLANAKRHAACRAGPPPPLPATPPLPPPAAPRRSAAPASPAPLRARLQAAPGLAAAAGGAPWAAPPPSPPVPRRRCRRLRRGCCRRRCRRRCRRCRRRRRRRRRAACRGRAALRGFQN
jgi:hypothetical protein